MAKRAKTSEHETGMVKVVDPFYDSPAAIEAHVEPSPPPPSRPGFGQRLRRFFDFILRLIASLIILGVIGLGLYYGLPLLYRKYVVPVEQNTAGLSDLQAQQKKTAQELAELQDRLKTLETQQNQNAQGLNKLDGRVGNIEDQIAAHTKSLAALDRMQSELATQDKATSAELQFQINVLKAMELLSRARLLMYQSNFGLARQDIQMARDLLAEAQKTAPKASGTDLDAVVRRLDLVLSDLPNFPVAATDDLNIAWQILLSGVPEAGPTLGPTLAPTITSTPVATFTSTAQVTVTPTAAQ